MGVDTECNIARMEHALASRQRSPARPAFLSGVPFQESGPSVISHETG